MQEMKGVIAQGQITTTELKGTLTLDVVDNILFVSGETEAMPAHRHHPAAEGLTTS